VLDNKTAKVGLKLEPGTTSETVEVSGAAAAVDQVAEAAPPIEDANQHGYVQKQVAPIGMQKASANSPQRAKAAIVNTARWTLSADGAVQRSLDLGKTWQKVPIALGASFRALSAVGSHVWAGGSGGTLYHSTDSGATWLRVQPTERDHKLATDITHIEFSDPANGSVNTSNGEVWTTSDGGQSWHRE
jgi:photosystem II stability/assembly factor-like uncharacterized protein